MRCTFPRTVGFQDDGKTICWSKNKYSKQYATFQLPCGKCINCRLQYSYEWAVRCVHEAQMHSENCFITLTYSDENLKSPKLQYRDFQLFMKRLRTTYPNKEIGMFVTGEYGTKNKRPHWHAILFGFEPPDKVLHRKNERGDEIYTSKSLDKIWGQNSPNFPNEIGKVTLQSAAYTARYAVKKLVHGTDEENEEWKPISKKSSHNAIGKKWLEKYYTDVFNHGRVVLLDGSEIGIPRYYERWFKKEKPDEWQEYATKKKAEIALKAQEAAALLQKSHDEINATRRDNGKLTHIPTENQKRNLITNQKFQKLQNFLKL